MSCCLWYMLLCPLSHLINALNSHYWIVNCSLPYCSPIAAMTLNRSPELHLWVPMPYKAYGSQIHVSISFRPTPIRSHLYIDHFPLYQWYFPGMDAPRSDAVLGFFCFVLLVVFSLWFQYPYIAVGWYRDSLFTLTGWGCFIYSMFFVCNNGTQQQSIHSHVACASIACKENPGKLFENWTHEVNRHTK